MLGLFKGVSRAASFVHGLVVTGAMAEAVESCIDEIIVAGDAALQEVEAKMYPGGAGDRRKISVE